MKTTRTLQLVWDSHLSLKRPAPPTQLAGAQATARYRRHTLVGRYHQLTMPFIFVIDCLFHLKAHAGETTEHQIHPNVRPRASTDS